MTDAAPTRADVERFGCDQLGMDKMPAGQCGMEDILRALMETHRRLAAKAPLHMGRLDQ